MAYSPGLREALMLDLPVQCPCCNQPLDYAMGHRGRNESVPSLDRVDNALGYTVTNTVIICRRCNRLKGDATLNDLALMKSYMQRHLQRADQSAAAADTRAEGIAARQAEREAALAPPTKPAT